MASTYFRLLMLISIASLCSCGPDTDDGHDLKRPKKTTAAPTSYKYAVYLENSGSLNGYLNVSGDSSFKTNVYDLITALSGFREKKSLDLYDINTITIPVEMNADAAGLDRYLSGLNANTFKERSKAKGGDQGQSDLHMIFKTILDKTGPDDVSLLITDGIFSPPKSRNAQDYLSQQRSSIQGFLTEKQRKQPLSTLVLQFSSDFKGTYYYQDNSHHAGSFKDRPYYVICLGRQEALHGLLQYVQKASNFKGFRDFLFLTDSAQYHINARIRNTQYYDYDQEEPMMVRNAKTGGRDHKFRIRINVDYARLPVSEAYLLNPDNYAVSAGYTIDSICRSSQNKFTHEVSLIAPAPHTGDISFSLKKQMPAWVATTNLDSDKGKSPEALAGKTFGIRYLLEGIYQAYTAFDHHPGYFSLSISVKE